MKIELITRVRSEELYKNLCDSAKNTSKEKLQFSYQIDKENLPRIAKTYNELAEKSDADILCFVHDDIEFVSDGWDARISELFKEGVEIAGVVGVEEYGGGTLFEIGYPKCFGAYVCGYDGKYFIKVLSHKYRNKKVQAVDGMIMFVSKDFFKREPFDESLFDELFYYDIDLCLRSKNAAITDILVKHYKPLGIWGDYPKEMKPIELYADRLYKKHGIKEIKKNWQACAIAPYEKYGEYSQDEIFDSFLSKYVFDKVGL